MRRLTREEREVLESILVTGETYVRLSQTFLNRHFQGKPPAEPVLNREQRRAGGKPRRAPWRHGAVVMENSHRRAEPAGLCGDS